MIKLQFKGQTNSVVSKQNKFKIRINTGLEQKTIWHRKKGTQGLNTQDTDGTHQGGEGHMPEGENLTDHRKQDTTYRNSKIRQETLIYPDKRCITKLTDPCSPPDSRKFSFGSFFLLRGSQEMSDQVYQSDCTFKGHASLGYDVINLRTVQFLNTCIQWTRIFQRKGRLDIGLQLARTSGSRVDKHCQDFS